MWSVGISISESKDAERIGYDYREINRIVVRVAQFFLNQDMRVIFGHDWREDGVMHAVSDFASKVASGEEGSPLPRVLNVITTGGKPMSRHALEAERNSGGVLQVIPASESIGEKLDCAAELTAMRCRITDLLAPGCRICLGGKEECNSGVEPGIKEEARLALKFGKPLYLMGGFGGATRSFGENDEYGRSMYWQANNGLGIEDKKELFDTTDVEHALSIISKGITQVAP